jgi:[acyl-carrier-protein] S-malonyltransferase
MRSPIAILCSGQGDQHRAMFALTGGAPEAAAVFATATELLAGQDPRRLVQEAAEPALFENYCGQILCCTQALAFWASLGDAIPEQAIFAGYSVGELAAWGCSGMVEPAELLQLASQRARVMNDASPPDSGLAAIVGLRQQALQLVLQGQEVMIAIKNGETSFVVGGRRPALEAVCQAATQKGARRAVILRVCVSSHTTLLAKATPLFAEFCAQAPVKMPRDGWEVLSGIDAERISDVTTARDKLSRQISERLDWSGCMEACHELGTRTALELGPGNALSRMATQQLPTLRVRSIEDFRTIEGIRSWLNRS